MKAWPFTVAEPSFSTYIERLHDHIDFSEELLSGALKRHLNVYLELLNNHIEYLDSFKSFCHGDLSLDNVIVRDNNYYLIDPIYDEKLYSSYLLDYSKILQSLRRHNRMIELQMFEELIESKLGVKILTMVKMLEISWWIRLWKYLPSFVEKEEALVLTYELLHSMFEGVQ
jgi:hypothetical protein